MRIILLLLLTVFMSSCGFLSTDKSVSLQGNTMGTYWNITIADNKVTIQKEILEQEIKDILHEVNQQFSTYIPDSEISRFNALTSTEPYTVSGEVVEVVQAAQSISELTGGAFDITVAPLVNLWGFGPELKIHKPELSAIEKTLKDVGYQYLKATDNPTSLIKEHSRLKVDLSAIAKGYGVDRLAQLLGRHGMKNYLIDIGGELKVKGFNPKGDLWRIAVEKPVSGKRQVQQLIQLDNIGVATSGDYHNYFEEDGVRYSHTIDPTTGKPITHKLASVTVLHQSAMMADALATAINTMGETKGLDFAKQQGLEVYMIVRADNGFTVISTLTQSRYALH